MSTDLTNLEGFRTGGARPSVDRGIHGTIDHERVEHEWHIDSDTNRVRVKKG